MSGFVGGERDPTVKKVRDLANDLILAQDKPESRKRGRAIFFVGAGCSVSAGIKAAPDVARLCAVKLARTYSRGAFSGADDAHDEALHWLIEEHRIELGSDLMPTANGSHWGHLYSYFFERHLKSPNQQRDIINEIIDAGKGLNWAHACLGELVSQRYVHTVMTTNFDQLALLGIIRTGLLPVIADGPEALNRITATPRQPQLVHLHGSVHTYNLRNSSEALEEMGHDPNALTMMFTLLQESDLLVVVGYSGGEEGVMKLIQRAAQTRPQLVIYWVTYDAGVDRLTPRCRSLLHGENKFLIHGGDADDFFAKLLRELRIGQPAWIEDPIGVLESQKVNLVPPRAPSDTLFLVEAYRRRVEYAADNRMPESDLGTKIAALRASGAFSDARRLFEAASAEEDPNVKDAAVRRLHALNALSLYDQDQQTASYLDASIAEFEELIKATDGVERLENVLSLAQALIDKSEQENAEGAGDASLARIVELTGQWLKAYRRSREPFGWARLKLARAQALQIQGERTKYDYAALRKSVVEYEAAIEAFEAARGADAVLRIDALRDAKSGLAAALQVLGSHAGDEAQLRRSVALHREVVDLSAGNARSTEEAGPLQNLAGGLMTLADHVPEAEAFNLRLAAKDALQRAIFYYEEDGNAKQAAVAREEVGNIDATLSDC